MSRLSVRDHRLEEFSGQAITAVPGQAQMEDSVGELKHEAVRIDRACSFEDMEACSEVIFVVLEKVKALYSQDSGTEWAWNMARKSTKDLRLVANVIKSGQLSAEKREAPHVFVQADELPFTDSDSMAPPINHLEPISSGQLGAVRNFAQYLRMTDAVDTESQLIQEVARKSRMVLKPGDSTGVGRHHGGVFDRQAVKFSWKQVNVLSPKGEKGERPYNITVATLEEIAMVRASRVGRAA